MPLQYPDPPKGVSWERGSKGPAPSDAIVHSSRIGYNDRIEEMNTERATTTCSIEPAPKKRKVEAAAPPNIGELHLERMPEAVLVRMLGFLTLEEVGQLAMSSKVMTAHIVKYITSEEFTSKFVRTASGPTDLSIQAQKVGLLIKRVSMLSTVSARLNLFNKLIKQIRLALRAKCTSIAQYNKFSFVGAALQKFISGWDYIEYPKVLNSLVGKWKKMNNSFSIFLSSTTVTDPVKERYIRQAFRRIFLDCSTVVDRSCWLGVLGSQLSLTQFAKLLIVLYGPTLLDGLIDWNFYHKTRLDLQDLRSFIELANALGCLQWNPEWSNLKSLQILVYISNFPSCWLLRSFSTLLLPLSCINMKLVVDYFILLYNTGRSSTAGLIIALCLWMMPSFSRLSVQVESCFEVRMESKWSCIPVRIEHVELLISHIVDSPLILLEREVATRDLVASVVELAENFAAVVTEDGTDSDAKADFRDLIGSWSHLSSNIMKRNCS